MSKERANEYKQYNEDRRVANLRERACVIDSVLGRGQSKSGGRQA